MAKPKNTIKGHNAERHFTNLFKQLGFDYCITARYGSRVHDDAGVDLINLPFNVQVKAGYERGLNIKNEIDYVKEQVGKLFPPNAPEHDRPTVLIHRKDVGRGKRRGETDDLVYMSFEDFEKIIKRVEKWE